MIKVVFMRSCDKCGNHTEDEDEILCRKCKPSLAVKAEIRECEEKIARAYWRFTRCARALPPSMAEPEAYKRLRELTS